jgi:DNA polymerase-3 subunit epsilon
MWQWIQQYFRKKTLQKKLQEAHLPDFLKAYHAACQSRPQGNEARLVVFDTETTGLDVQKDQILSIGAIAIEKGEIVYQDSFEAYIRRSHTGDQASVPVHQILSQELQHAAEEAKVMQDFLAYMRGDILVAHHAAFDQAMLQKLMQKSWGFPLLNPVIDTFSLAMRLEQGRWDTQQHEAGKYSLDALCQQYHIQNHARHSALGDALATAELFLHLWHKAQKQGIGSFKELLM